MLATLLSLATLSAAPPAPMHAGRAGQQGPQVFVPPPLAIFPERTSVRPGERIAIHARSENAEARLEVVAWRSGARLLKSRAVEIPPPADRRNEATGGCAWTPCTTIEIPESARSDVYLVRVTSAGETVSAPLVVRAARPGARSRALVLHPEAALAAASEWGGASFYATAYGPPVPAVALDRPLVGERVGAVANGAFLDWLAALDFAVEHASDLDLARDETLLDPYDLVLFPHRHPYWTREMRAAFDAFVHNGGRVLILGGGFGTFRARLEDRGLTLHAYAFPEHDPWYADPRAPERVAGPFAHGPVNDPEERSFGLAARHATLGLSRDEGFGALRVHAPDHPFLRDTGVSAEGLLGLNLAGERLLAAVAGASDGANLERLDGVVLASRASGAPTNLRVLATAPATDGFACIAEHGRFGTVAHFGSDAIARDTLAGGGLPDVQTLLASALLAYAPPRRSLIRNGGFERWTRIGEAWFPVGFQVAGGPYPAEVAGGDDALAAGDGRRAAVWQHVLIPPGDVHLVAWTSAHRSAVRLDVGNGFVLAQAEPAGWSERFGGYRYARATVDEPREAFLTCEVAAHGGGVIDRVEVVPESAWRRALALDWRVDSLGPGERVTSDPVALDSGSTYLVTVAGFGRGEVTLVGADGWQWRADASQVPGEVAVGVLRLPRHGGSAHGTFELRAHSHLTEVELGVLPLHAASPGEARERAYDMGSPGDWALPADGWWETVPGVVDRGVELVDETISLADSLPAKPSRITLWTRAGGTLEVRLVNHMGGVLFRAQLRAGSERWTPHVVRVEPLPWVARLELTALGPVHVDRVRIGIEPLALRDDHVPNGAFELVPAPPESAHEATDWHDRPPGWTVAAGELFLDPVEAWRGDHALRLEPREGRATARLRVPDPLRVDRAWRATLAARAEPGARGEVALLVAWPGAERRITLASAWLTERAWSDVSLGATVADLAGALDALRVPHRSPGATARAWIELTAEGGPVWIDDLTLDED